MKKLQISEDQRVTTLDNDLFTRVKHSLSHNLIHSRCGKCILAILVLLILVVCIQSALLIISSWNNHSKSRVCVHAECVEASMGILTYVNSSIDPCEDFYSFTCGKWINNVQRPFRKMEEDNHFRQTHIRVNEDILRLFETPPTQTRLQKIHSQVKTFFDACLENAAKMRVGILHWEDALIKHGVFNMFVKGGLNATIGNSTYNETEGSQDFSDNLMRLARSPFHSFFYHIGVTHDLNNNGKPYVKISSVGCVYKPKNMNKDQEKTTVFNYVRKFQQIVRTTNLYRPLDPEKILDFCLDLDKHLVEEPSPEKNIQTSKFKHLNNITEGCDLINFTRHVELTFSYAGVQLSSDVVMLITPKNLFSSICKFWKKYLRTPEGQKLLYDHLFLHVYYYVMHYLPKLHTTQLRTMQLLPLQCSNSPVSDSELSLIFCCYDITSSLHGEIIAALYVNEYHAQFSLDKIMGMVQNIQEATKSLLQRAHWMSPISRVDASKKVDNLKRELGFTRELLNTTAMEIEFIFPSEFNHFIGKVVEMVAFNYIRQLRFISNFPSNRYTLGAPHAVNAFYHMMENLIFIPVGIMNGIFYNSRYPDYMNYGSLGNVIAHEVGHGFDNLGRKFDYNGILREWWDMDTVTSYNQLTQCYVNQYNKFDVLNKTVDGNKTLGENIADNMGLKICYTAFKNSIRSSGEVPSTLPGINYTAEQMFFIAFGRMWCSNAWTHSETAVHSPMMYRLIGTLSNSKEFSDAFNCPVGSAMNPKNKCHLL